MMLQSVSIVLVSLALFTHTMGRQTPDLSTPERSLNGFLAASSSGKLTKAAAYVVDGSVSPTSLKQLTETSRDERIEMSVENVKAVIDGEKATVTFTLAMKTFLEGVRGLDIPSTEESISMKRIGNDWKILPLSEEEILRTFSSPDQNNHNAVSLLASTVVYPELFVKYRRKISSVRCLKRMQQLCLFARMHFQDFDDRVTLSQTLYKNKLMPYFLDMRKQTRKENPAMSFYVDYEIKHEVVFHCPEDISTVPSFAFNSKLSGLLLVKAKQPKETVLFYEGAAGKLKFRHDGYAAIGFLDGHCKFVTANEAKSLRWNP